MDTIADLAVLVRSKNAGAFWLTIDVMFDNPEHYRRVRDSEAINRAGIAAMFRREPADINRRQPRCGIGDQTLSAAAKLGFQARQRRLMAGSQQYAPLLSLAIPIDGGGGGPRPLVRHRRCL
jgi:hypothetical protein